MIGGKKMEYLSVQAPVGPFAPPTMQKAVLVIAFFIVARCEGIVPEAPGLRGRVNGIVDYVCIPIVDPRLPR